MCSGVGSRVLLDWVSPFGHPRITARLPAPRGLSQAPTSFIGSWCQGIHRVPLKTCHRKLKMLASTMQFSSYERNPPPNPTPTPHPPGHHPDSTRSGSPRQRPREQRHPPQGPAPVPSGPNSVPSHPPTSERIPPRPKPGVLPTSRSSSQLVDVPPMSNHPGTRVRAVALDPTPPPRRAATGRASMLLRKEVIQPHLPVRLPCYDFVPIASPTFDDSLPQGVGPSASGVTDFRDVTGGVYKARERIHRSVADLRLLATPTSRGRVADPDPN